MRQPGAIRHELLGEQIVEVDPSLFKEVDLLMVTIMDDANEFVHKSTKR